MSSLINCCCALSLESSPSHTHSPRIPSLIIPSRYIHRIAIGTRISHTPRFPTIRVQSLINGNLLEWFSLACCSVITSHHRYSFVHRLFSRHDPNILPSADPLCSESYFFTSISDLCMVYRYFLVF
ncbi:hypothetical protein SISSUDRAFT_670432 [Sistotremastrum suecicum HHB10207 ss-3]|uniref:Uncharacterized protein n=1 Tax=Sistotremastrum suecicum HHB10207 ss-3 TaxID=1314776 RepID=A0A166E187_9AGAM|nr:hypothetical protein SISSUDRAFT_670432 [Sistotremastrum suecicum HHB10207 ss-3]